MSDPDPSHAARLVGEPYVAPVWTELAYEQARRDVAPAAVSRLGALYLFADPFEAFDFATRHVIRPDGFPQAVFEVTVDAGTRWHLVDMTLWQVQELGDGTATALQAAWDRGYELGRRYWTFPPGPEHAAELLVAGTATIRASVDLLSALRSRDMLV